MEDRWFGNEFQILGATDENDLEVAMVVLRGGTHIEKDEEERSARAGTYHIYVREQKQVENIANENEPFPS